MKSHLARRLVIGLATATMTLSVGQAALAVPASAATPPAAAVFNNSGTLAIIGGGGREEISLRGDAQSITVDSFNAPLNPNAECPQGADSTIVVCKGPFTRVSYTGLNGDDKLNVKEVVGVGAFLDGGSGDDVLIGSPSDDLLIGSGGNDSLRGGGGNDELRGGVGPGPGVTGAFDPDKDFLSGGSGVDTVNYNGHRADALVTLDDVANDGMPGENDNVKSDIESVKEATIRD